MECLNALMLRWVWQNMIKPFIAASFQATFNSSVFSYENIFPLGLADVAGLALRSDPAVHSKTWRYDHTNPVTFGYDEKHHPILGRNNNDPMATDAVGFSILGRDSS